MFCENVKGHNVCKDVQSWNLFCYYPDPPPTLTISVI